MLALFYGTDRTSVRDAGQAYLRDQGLGVGVATQVGDGDYSAGRVVESIAAQSLFGGTEFYVLDTPSNDSEFEAEVIDNLKELAASANVFVVLESSLLAPARKKYEKHTDTVEEKIANKAERFNTFAIAEALAKKDKKNLWMLLQQARETGVRDEELVGILWWQLKALSLASLTNTADEANMKDYPYKKAQQALRNFNEGEVSALMQSLLELYHEGHQGVKDMDVALEQWILTV